MTVKKKNIRLERKIYMDAPTKKVLLKIIWFKKNGRLFLRFNDRFFNIYKEEHQEIPELGRCLIVLYIQDNKAFLQPGKAF